MNATFLAVALSLVSAVAYAAAAVAQERIAARTREGGTGLLRLLGSAPWWGSVALNATGALLHVAALRYGPLTLVQPLGALTLVAAVPLGARWAGRRVSRVEWRGTALTLIGLGALLSTASGPAPDGTLSLPEATGVAVVTLVVIGALTRSGGGSGLRHATASGFASGVASALTQTVTVALAAPGKDSLPTGQALLVAGLVAAFAMGGLLLAQVAFRGGLGAPLAVVTLANPVAAATIGLSLLGERLQGGPVGIVLALVGALVAARGVVVLSRAAAAPPAVLPGRKAGGPATMPVPITRDLGARDLTPRELTAPLLPLPARGEDDPPPPDRGAPELVVSGPVEP